MPPGPTPDAAATNRRRIIAGMLLVSVGINRLARSDISIAGGTSPPPSPCGPPP